MRLSKEQIENINNLVAGSLGQNSSVFLFGSRKDDNARGGDVDLYVETPSAVSLLERARLQMRLENALGLPVDLLIKTKGETAKPFEKIVYDQAVPLREASAS